MSSPDRARPSLHVACLSRHFDSDSVRVIGFRGQESIGTLFRFEIDLLSTDPTGVPRSAAGRSATLLLEPSSGEVRQIRGIISQIIDRFHDRQGLRHQSIVLVPHAHRLSMVETQDIHMDISVPELIVEKLRNVGLGRDVDVHLLSEYPKREFIVQYCETDLAFVSRLAEHLGIGIFFEERGGRTRIVLSDHPSGYAPVATEPLAWTEWGEGRGVHEISTAFRLIPTYYVVRDYNERAPQVDLTTFEEVAGAHPGGIVEVGPNVLTPEESQSLARVRAEASRATQLVFEGKSAVPSLFAGGRFRLGGHPEIGDTDLLITSVVHVARRTGDTIGPDVSLAYTNTFSALDANIPYRPPRRTKRPTIAGLVTAVVDPGPRGIEKYAQVDQEGRYWLRFLFDTTPVGKRTASLPIRMLQSHAGEGYGTHWPLKPGTEVLVAFVNGDPDRPILAGAVHNPLTPAVVTEKTPVTHRLRTSGGVTFDIVDEP